MAGDWIKVEQATVDKPEVLRIAELLNWERRKVLGLLVEFWCWLDKNMADPCPENVRETSGFCPGDVRNMSKKSLDDVMHTPGFASCLEAVGWAQFDDERAVMHVINAERHNGNTAKSRALDAKRKREGRRKNVREMSGSQPDENRTREEKRREEINTKTSLPDWLPKSEWDSFVEMRKKGKSPFTDRAATLALSELEKLRAQGHDPAAVINASVLNGWKSFYAPKTGPSPGLPSYT